MNNTDTTQAANPLDGITAAIESAIQQAREQAGTIIENARAEAEQIVADARAEAEQIIADAGEQANTRARDDMERASLAIQEHAAALHTLALGLTGHETTPNANNADDNATSGTDASANTDTNEAGNADNSNANANDADTIPPAPTVTNPNNTPTTKAPTTSSSTVTAHPTTRRANGATRKLAPWEQPQEPQSETAPEPEETPTIDTTEGNNPEHTSTAQDAPVPQWDTPLIIDAPLRL